MLLWSASAISEPDHWHLTSSDNLAVSSADKYTHDTGSKHCCAITTAHRCTIAATLYDTDTNSDDLASADTYANGDCGTDWHRVHLHEQG